MSELKNCVTSKFHIPILQTVMQKYFVCGGKCLASLTICDSLRQITSHKPIMNSEAAMDFPRFAMDVPCSRPHDSVDEGIHSSQVVSDFYTNDIRTYCGRF